MVEPSELDIHTDPVILNILSGNLVENAIIHSDSGATTVQITASELTERENEVRFEIRDTNEPIPDMRLKRFVPAREPHYRTGEESGSGFPIGVQTN